MATPRAPGAWSWVRRASLARDVFRDLRPMGIAFVLAFEVGCLLLGIGQPRRSRIAAGVVLAVPLAVLEMILASG